MKVGKRSYYSQNRLVELLLILGKPCGSFTLEFLQHSEMVMIPKGWTKTEILFIKLGKIYLGLETSSENWVFILTPVPYS